MQKPASVYGRQRVPLCNISFENSLQLLRFDYVDRFQAGEGNCLVSLTFLQIRGATFWLGFCASLY